MLQEIKSVRERQDNLIKNSFSHKALNESIKFDQCKFLKNKIYDLKNILDKFTKGENNLNVLLGN